MTEPTDMIDSGGCGSSEPYALRVLGDSMEPEFADGTIIVIDPSGVIEDGSYVIAAPEEDYVFRQLQMEGGRYFLTALNTGYEAIEIAGLSAIKGVIVQKAGTRRQHRKHYV